MIKTAKLEPNYVDIYTSEAKLNNIHHALMKINSSTFHHYQIYFLNQIAVIFRFRIHGIDECNEICLEPFLLTFECYHNER